MNEKRKNLAILAVVLAVVAGSAALVAVRGFTLGLDLRGGLEVVLKAKPRPGVQVTSDILNTAATVMRKRIDPQGVKSPEIRTSLTDKTINIAIPGVTDPNQVADLLVASQLQSFDLPKFLSAVSRQGPFAAKPTASLYDLLTAAQKRIDAKGTPEGWALFDKKTHNLVKNARIEPQKQQVLDDINASSQPAGTVFLPVPKGFEAVSCDPVTAGPCPGGPSTFSWYLFAIPPPDQVITGDQVSAQSTTDNAGQPIVNLNYKNGGAGEFTKITAEIASLGKSAGAPLENAIIVDGKIVATPTVDYNQFPNGIDATLSGGSEITGLTKSEADRIALEVQSGALPISFAPESENIVSATLGRDSLRNGLIAGAAGLAFVMVFLLFFYGFLGLIADIALIIYGVVLAGIVSGFPVTMTLPGIAGTILTIGVAADANIVIFERIKEEVRAGKSMRSAIATGYRRGFHTIIDANVVTLITALVLYAAASSSVKGFALMLLIGVVTSIFTAVVATRAMLGVLSGFRFMSNPRVLGAVGSGDRWKKYDLIGKKRLWFAVSGIAILAGAFSLGAKGLNEGIDFSGGSQLQFTTAKPQSVGHVTNVVSAVTGGSPVVKGVVGATQSSGSTFSEFQVQSHFLSQGQQTRLETALKSQLGVDTNHTSRRNVSSSFGRSVLNAAILAVIFSLIIIFIYVSFRFEWKFAVPVMVALFHDLVITVGFYSVVGREVTADTVAAVLTVLGYSLYDTVIVFDRVRENIPILRRMTASKIVNESLAETITRSLNTSFVTVVPVVLLFIFGSGSLKDFAFALIVGIVSGAYSSIFIAAPLLAVLLEREPGFVRRRHELERDAQPAAPAAAAAMPSPAGVGQSASGGDGDGAPKPGPAPAPPAGSSAQRRRRRRAHGRAR